MKKPFQLKKPFKYLNELRDFLEEIEEFIESYNQVNKILACLGNEMPFEEWMAEDGYTVEDYRDRCVEFKEKLFELYTEITIGEYK